MTATNTGSRGDGVPVESDAQRRTTRGEHDELEGEPTSPAIQRPVALAPGTLVGGAYRIRSEIGTGGMGTVYLARDEGLERDVALKLIRADATGAAARERFRVEARTMARMSHPNVVGVYALGEIEGQPYIVMEHVPGIPLSRLVRERPEGLRPEEAIVVLDQVCRGASAIHTAGLIHRDLKPANVLVGPAFRIVVADLGLTHRRDSATSTWGTPAYLAPELASGVAIDEAVAPRIDVYAIGVMAYELFTGTLPFATETERLGAMSGLVAPEPPSQRRPGLDPAFDAPILAALAWTPELRTPSVDALRRALTQAALATHPLPHRPVRLIVVDDDDGYAQLGARVLVRAFHGCTVETAPDGPEALAALRAHAFDLAVVDLDMPKMNGVELTAAIREDPATAALPVIVASAIGGPADWALLTRLGANAFLGKPYEAAQLTLLARMLVRP
jgi:serine/threonine-protein kinase